MSKKLFVGNLSFNTTEETLKAKFDEFGATEEVALITDRETGRSRGFAFVTYTEDAAADEAMKALDGQELDGREIKVNEAKPKREE